MAEAKAARPSIVGKALNQIAKQDAEILETVMDVMETEQLLSSAAPIDVLPNNTSVLVQLGENANTAPVVAERA